MAEDRARRPAFLLLAVSGGLVLGALAFQVFGGLTPCRMCHWQRWAHLGVIGLAALALLGPRLLPAALAAMTASAGLAAFHVGVEQRWWDGPGCAAPLTPGDDLLGSLITAPIARCDQIPWSFLGLSMAAWNLVFSIVALAGAIILWRRAWTSTA
ncbi:disulfide bond formation protein B [Thermaurantiacus sp.]